MVSPNSEVQHEGRPGHMRKVSICGGEQMWVSGSMTPQRWPGSQGSAPASPAHGAEAPGELGHGAETRAGGRRLVCSVALQLVTHSETATRPPCRVICVEQPPPPHRHCGTTAWWARQVRVLAVRGRRRTGPACLCALQGPHGPGTASCGSCRGGH